MQCAIQCTNCTQKSELKFLMKMLEHILIPQLLYCRRGLYTDVRRFLSFSSHRERWYQVGNLKRFTSVWLYKHANVTPGLIDLNIAPIP